ncbi:glycosyltransferase family 4 protein [Patescibacteria group bacterium]|nr:glycosyltransferase family 4 protein [Patescibacteria group bacterium]MBU1028821.1 glycosyltransferase family 4 protein [Patescibacteria group bacterium]MBU1916410.1 glycosyltransferase family 4 protein [Patescibacteria group bacterium]
MRIAVDIRPLLECNRAGVSLYTLNLVRKLIESGAHDYALFCNSSHRPAPIDVPTGSKVNHYFSQYPNRLLNTSFAFLGWPKIETLVAGADLVYLPNLNFIATNRPLVVTVHDLSFRRYPRFFSKKQRLWHCLVNAEKMIKKAAAVIAVSQHTKDEIIESFGVSPDRIHVVTPAVGAEYRPSPTTEIATVRQKYNLPEKFIFYLGTLEPRKNVTGLIAAYNQLESDVGLVLAGGEGWLYQHIYAAAKNSPKRQQIKFIGYVAEADKPALYSAASIFAYPSFYEGFGMPALEAMACGTPVVASHTSSLGEVVGDGGLLVNPARVDELVLSLQELLSNKKLCELLAEKGIKRAQQFTWKRSAVELEKVFSSLFTA